MSRQSIRSRGRITIEIRDRDDRLLDRRCIHNLLVTEGASLMRDALAGVAGAALTYIAYGTGTTAPVIADTTLETEVLRDTISAFDVDNPGILICQHYLDTSTGNGNTITEIALFGGSTASGTVDTGQMYSRALLGDPLEKTVDIAITLWWELTWEGVE